jgi:hypothetical protein
LEGEKTRFAKSRSGFFALSLHSAVVRAIAVVATVLLAAAGRSVTEGSACWEEDRVSFIPFARD